MKRIDTFGLLASLGIYMGDITLISVLKDKADGKKKRRNGIVVRCMDLERRIRDVR
jgi:hypothetical protein